MIAAVALAAQTVEAGLARLNGPNHVYDEYMTINRFDAAFDTASQLYLLVWGTSAAGPAKGQLLNAAGMPQGSPFAISDGSLHAGWARAIYSPEEGKFLLSYTKILGPGRHQRVARFLAYQSGSLNFGPEMIIDTWSGGSGEASGMAYSRGRFLVTWWNWDAGAFPQTFVTILNSAGSPIVTKKQITLSGDGETDPEIACDQTRGRCLVIGHAWGVFNGGSPATWATVIADDTGETLKPLFYAHSGPIEKEQTVAYSPAGNKFIIAFSNFQHTILGLTLDGSDLSLGAPYTIRQPTDDASAVGFGRPRLAYNSTTQTTLVAIKPWIGRTGAMELTSTGGLMPETWQMTPLATTNFAAGTQEIAQAADPVNSRFLVADQQAYLRIRATVFGAAGSGGAGPSPTPAGPTAKAKADVNGDGKSDITLFRPHERKWYTVTSKKNFAYEETDPGTFSVSSFGDATGVPVPADYDGDGKMDLAQFAESGSPGFCTWSVKYSSQPVTAAASTTTWGFCSDTPLPADFDGDGKADLAVYRPTTGRWYVLLSGSGFETWINRKWGLAPEDGIAGQDTPVAGDYDGDKKADFAVYRPATGVWYVLYSSSGWVNWGVTKWGLDTTAIPGDYVGDGNPDQPAPADFDGDGKHDLAVFRPSTGTWFVLHSSSNYATYSSLNWGLASDSLAPADYDGDGRANIAVFRPSTGTWYIYRPGTDNWYISWGANGDLSAIAR
jgi:hypothetical protein